MIQATDSVDDIVSESISAAKVLSRYGIDFCYDGSRSLKDACAEAGISLRKLLREIGESEPPRYDNTADLSTLGIDELTLYIEAYHHHYTVENITFIKASLGRLVRLFGDRHPELSEIKSTFDEMTAPLLIHMQHEEYIVFPYIRRLAKTGKRVKDGIYRAVYSPLPGMLTDHEKGQAYLKKLGELTHGYQPPEQGNAFRVTYAAMRELERNLQAHLALESEVLFPKALEIEGKLARVL